MKDLRMNAFLDFFSGQGFSFVDGDTGESLVDNTLTLCEDCCCMTKTLKKDNTCLKCGAKRGE